MSLLYFRNAALIATLLSAVHGQTATIVPQDLASAFAISGIDVQASYTDNAVDGFRDGSIFGKDAVTKEPTFALGDSSGISPMTLYTIILVDTTCPKARKLHYARPNFKYNFDITNINTSSAALLDYRAPGAFGETGDNRQYSFLMYTNPAFKVITSLKLPKDGDILDVKQFQNDNGFDDPDAGLAMVVNLGGQADCASDSANPLPSSLPTPKPAPSTAARTSASALPTNNSTESFSTANGSNDSNESDASPTATPTTSGRQSNVVVATSVLKTHAPGPFTITSTIFLSSMRLSGAGAPTASGGLAQQTANAASGISLAQKWTTAPLLGAFMVLWG